MLSHTIIKTKFKHRWHPQENTQDTTTKPVGTGPALTFNPTVKEYNTYIENAGVAIGAFVVHKANDTIISKHQIHVVVGVNHFLTSVKRWLNGHPCAFKMLQVYPHSSHKTIKPWIRFEAATAYREITLSEYQIFIGPEIDYVRNYIEQNQNSDPD